jgi:hypothetical protein
MQEQRLGSSNSAAFGESSQFGNLSLFISDQDLVA